MLVAYIKMIGRLFNEERSELFIYLQPPGDRLEIQIR